MIKSLNANLVGKGAPVIIGEWGTSNVDKGAGMTDYDLRKADMFSFVDYFVKQCKANNIATFYWMGISSGISRLYPAFDQPDLALKILQAYHGTGHNPILPAVTGIPALTTNQVDNGLIYNLHGQRLLSPSKGIYIQGHKKFIRK